MRYQLTKMEEKIFRRVDTGGLIVRHQWTDPTTGKRKDTPWAVERLPGMSEADYLRAARVVRDKEIRDAIADTARANDPARVRFSEHCEKVFQSKLDTSRITSRQTEKKYRYELDKYILPEFGDKFVDRITFDDIQEWMNAFGRKVKAGEFTPNTVNGFLQTLKVFMKEAAHKYRIYDPSEGIHAISTTQHETYTVDEPNQLDPDELKPFFKAARHKDFQRHFAALLLGTITGRRACELRPLRATDPKAEYDSDWDLNWSTGRLLVRRSQTYGDPSKHLKQKRHVLAWLTDELIYELEEHRERMSEAQRETGLLFPPMRLIFSKETSGFMARSALNKVIPAIAEKAKIKKHLTPRFMRRTYQDWCRAAGVNQTVQMAMSGHATTKMKEWYSTAGEKEGQKALKSMCRVAGIN